MIYISIIAIILTALALLLNLKRDMMMLQQNSNRNDRYRRWLDTSGESTKLPRLTAIIIALVFLVRFMPNRFALVLAAIYGLWLSANLLVAKYKKPLVFTKRAIRIYSTAIVLVAILCFVDLILHFPKAGILVTLTFVLMVANAVSYVFILAANWLLKPVEKHINKKYYDDAAARLASMPDLKVIGITGSYGKTSTKHYLYRILSEHFDVLMTPGNFNTTLGVIRTIRENMKPYNQIFIAEMGAKQIGDIKEICDLVHPQIGIITAVGPQHLESFKTIENVQATKFELADALPSDGLAVVNNDFQYIANREVNNVECVRYAVSSSREAQGRGDASSQQLKDISKEAQYYATDIEYTPQGTYFTVTDGKGDDLRLYTHLVGECNVSNLLAAVIVARHLGVPDSKIKYAVEKIEQVEHRLNLKRTAAGITIIDDAYNSNPVGSGMALDVLAGMKGGKRIIITPGMIELGEKQYDLNRDFGAKIATSADIAIIVGDYNRQSIAEGIDSVGMPNDCVHYVPTFNEAQQLMLSIAQAGDTVLYENDLPDTFK